MVQPDSEYAALKVVGQELVRQRNAWLAILAGQLKELFERTDPNWLRVVVRLERPPVIEPRTFETLLGAWCSFEGPPAFSAKPVFAYLQGPKAGDVEIDVAEVIKHTLPAAFVALAQVEHLLKEGYLGVVTFENPAHLLKPIPGVTMFRLDGGNLGFVLTSDPERFVVARCTELGLATSLQRYSVQEVRVERAVSDRRDDMIAGYAYLPRRYDEKGLPLTHAMEAFAVQGAEAKALLAKLPAKLSRVDLKP